MDREGAVLAQPPAEFNFDSACSTPYISAPSSPQRFGTFFSAPTSPRLASAFFRELDRLSLLAAAGDAVSASVAEQFERLKRDDGDGEEEFEFSFSGPMPRASLSADELFDGGKIKPLKPAIRFGGTKQEQSTCRSGERNSTGDSAPPRSIKQDSRSYSNVGASKGRSSAAELNHSRRNLDQFLDGTRNRGAGAGEEQSSRCDRVKESGSGRRGSWSAASSFRISDILSCPDEDSASPSTSSSSSSVSLAAAAAKGLRKWLFRSKSEGHAPSEETPRNSSRFAVPSRRSGEAKGASFRSKAERGGGGVSGSVSMRRGGAVVSAHELHYKAKRAVSEEMRRRTFLPYKQGLLGCLGFNPCVREISKGLGSVTRG